jgi:hypothetical protein
LTHVSQHNYNLGAEYCRQTFRQGVVCIFVREKLKYSNVNLNEFCKDDDLEICAVKLPFSSGNICTVAIYRATSGNFLHFLNGLDAILESLYNTNSKLMICGDINLNYPVDNNRRKQLTPCYPFNLSHTVYFPYHNTK